MSKKDELVTLLCSKFFKPVTAGGADPLPGQIVSAHAVYPPDEPWIVKVLAYDGYDPNNSRYEIKKFHPDDRSHFPLAELQLRRDENFYVYRGKERPSVVLGMVKSRWANPHYDETVFSCAPLFSFKPIRCL